MDTTNESYSESEEDSVKVLENHEYNLMEQSESNKYETEVTPLSENEDDLEDLFKTTAIDSHEETVKTYKYQRAINKEKVDKLRKISEMNENKIKQLTMIITHLRKQIKIASVKKKT